MNVVRSRPPNFADIVRVFPHAAKPGILFTYGDSIYCIGLPQIPKSLMVHEGVHSRRQGDDPAAWWDRYLRDLEFRFIEELAAHRAEYESAVAGVGRHERRRNLVLIAKRLAGPLYGHMVSLNAAKRLIIGDLERAAA